MAMLTEEMLSSLLAPMLTASETWSFTETRLVPFPSGLVTTVVLLQDDDDDDDKDEEEEEEEEDPFLKTLLIFPFSHYSDSILIYFGLLLSH
jgi:hypothetical protein